MNEQINRKGDFEPKYYNAKAIMTDSELQPAEQVCELVKHYSMCLFGIATDISEYYAKIKEKDRQIEQLKKDKQRLYNKCVNLSMRVKMQDNEPQQVIDELAKLQVENQHLKGIITRYKKSCDKLNSDTTVAELKQKLKCIGQQLRHYKNRAIELETLCKAKGVIDNGK